MCELLGIELPFVEAPLSADPRLPAAVSNAGGLGTLGLGWADDAGAVVRENGSPHRSAVPRQLRPRVRPARSSRARRFGGSAGRVAVLGRPQHYFEFVHDAAGPVMHTVGSVEEARCAVGRGVDIVVAQGWEAGGHVWGGVATLPLVPAVVDAVAPVPVIAAGGIGDAEESPPCSHSARRPLCSDPLPLRRGDADPRGVQAPSDSRERDRSRVDTNLYEVGWPDTSDRALHNSTAGPGEAAGRPAPAADPGGRGGRVLRFGRIYRSIRTGAPDGRDDRRDRAVAPYAGQSVALARRTEPAAEIVAELVAIGR